MIIFVILHNLLHEIEKNLALAVITLVSSLNVFLLLTKTIQDIKPDLPLLLGSPGCTMRHQS
jgi:hypothetical protein